MFPQANKAAFYSPAIDENDRLPTTEGPGPKKGLINLSQPSSQPCCDQGVTSFDSSFWSKIWVVLGPGCQFLENLLALSLGLDLRKILTSRNAEELLFREYAISPHLKFIRACEYSKDCAVYTFVEMPIAIREIPYNSIAKRLAAIETVLRNIPVVDFWDFEAALKGTHVEFFRELFWKYPDWDIKEPYLLPKIER